MFLLNCEGVCDVISVDADKGEILMNMGFPLLGIKDGRKIFKYTEKVAGFLSENKISFERE